jgi:hypothetical protein
VTRRELEHVRFFHGLGGALLLSVPLWGLIALAVAWCLA